MPADKQYEAFIAWTTAIGYARVSKSNKCIEVLAKEFGARITDDENLQIMRELFNWDKVAAFIERRL